MYDIDEKEVEDVLAKCSKHIDKMISDYSKFRLVPGFEPEVAILPVGMSGFMAVYSNEKKEALASVLSFEGNIIYTSYAADINMLN